MGSRTHLRAVRMPGEPSLTINLHHLTQRCCGGCPAEQVKAELGKKDAIHWLAMIYRDVIEDPGGDQLQLLLYTLTVLCDGNRACPVVV